MLTTSLILDSLPSMRDLISSHYPRTPPTCEWHQSKIAGPSSNPRWIEILEFVVFLLGSQHGRGSGRDRLIRIVLSKSSDIISFHALTTLHQLDTNRVRIALDGLSLSPPSDVLYALADASLPEDGVTGKVLRNILHKQQLGRTQNQISILLH